MTSANQAAEALLWALRLKFWRAHYQKPDPDRVGYVIVDLETSDGVAVNRSVRNKRVGQMVPGIAVIVGLDFDYELAVIENDFVAQVMQGLNPLANNPADRNFYGVTNQDSIATLRSYPLGTDDSPSMVVVVRRWIYVHEGTWYELPSQQVDLTTAVPSAGEMCIAGLWVNPGQEQIVVTTSTPQPLIDPLDLTDVQECQAGVDENHIPVKFWKLYGGMTEIDEADDWLDGRQIINVGGGAGGDADSEAVEDAFYVAWIGL